MRKKDRMLAEAIVELAARAGGTLTDEIKRQALAMVREATAIPKDPKKQIAIVDVKLRNPDVRAAIRDVYAEFGDFSVEDAVQLHVQHIRGYDHPARTVEKAGPDGEVTTLTITDHQPPSYQALKDFVTMALPQPAKALKADVSLSLGAIGRQMLGNVPPVEPRAIGPAQVEDFEEGQVVEGS